MNKRYFHFSHKNLDSNSRCVQINEQLQKQSPEETKKASFYPLFPSNDYKRKQGTCEDSYEGNKFSAYLQPEDKGEIALFEMFL